MMASNDLTGQRTAAARYLVKNFSREERYLKIFSRDFQTYLLSADWLKSQEARKYQKFFDFQCDFLSLKKKMKEFRWSKEFLLEKGIDFTALKKLYFEVVG